MHTILFRRVGTKETRVVSASSETARILWDMLSNEEGDSGSVFEMLTARP